MSASKSYGKVAVICGGWSDEREVSLNSGKAVHAGLQSAGIDAELIDLTLDNLDILISGNYSRVFNTLHGVGGEDGVIQGLLEALRIPYIGSGIKASAITMDKILTKQLWLHHGMPTPRFAEITAATDWALLVEDLGLPLIIKPVGEGSSVGMSRVDELSQLAAAYDYAATDARRVFAEQWVTGEEYTVAFVNDEVLPAIRLETPHQFYDYSAKYQSDDTVYHCPCGLDEKTEQQLKVLVLEASNAVAVTGWGRVDLMRDQSGKFWLIEVNTVPGMTDHSLVPKAAKVAGMTFPALLLKILDTSFQSKEVEYGT